MAGVDGGRAGIVVDVMVGVERVGAGITVDVTGVDGGGAGI